MSALLAIVIVECAPICCYVIENAVLYVNVARTFAFPFSKVSSHLQIAASCFAVVYQFCVTLRLECVLTASFALEIQTSTTPSLSTAHKFSPHQLFA